MQLTASMAHVSVGKTSILQQLMPFDAFGYWRNGVRAVTEKLDKELDHWLVTAGFEKAQPCKDGILMKLRQIFERHIGIRSYSK